MPAKGVGEAPISTTIVLRPASGDLYLKIRRQKQVVVDGTYDSGENVPTRDVARRHRMFPKGAGWSSRPGALEQGIEWDAFAESVNACSRFGYVCPSGEQTAVSVTAGWGVCNKIIAFNGDLFFIFLNRIVYLVNGTGAFVDLYNNAGDTFNDAEIWDSSLRVALACTHAGANIHCFVTISVGAPYTVINPTPALPAGTGITVATPQCFILATVFWEYQGISAFRLVAKNNTPHQIQWMITPTGDPYDALNWGPVVAIGPSTMRVDALVASHDTVWAIKRDGVYAIRDATALAGGENLTPYWQNEVPATGGIGGFYWQDQMIVYRTGVLEAINVNSWQVQDKPMPISIEFGRPNATALNAYYYTALSSDNQWLVAAMQNIAAEGYILYGVPRRRESATAGVTEYDWFPEIGPITGGLIHTLFVFTPTAGRPTLWFSYEQGSSDDKLIRVDLFKGGSPLADSGHRYNTTASFTLTDEHFAARSATKGALRAELAVRNCGSTRKVDVYAVAGAGAAFPGSPNASITTNVEASTLNLTSVRGNVIRTKVALTSTATVPVVIDEIGLKANLGFPLRRRGTWMVELSNETEGDLPNFATPSETEAALKALCESVESFTVTDDEGNPMTVCLDNVLPWQREDGPMTDLAVRQKVRLLSVGWQEVG